MMRVLHLQFAGMPISVEWPKGSVRKGKSASGATWSRPMHAHYGYIRGTEGTDGDHIDVYIGDTKHEDADVYVIDQMKSPDFTEFDEQKIMLGYKSQDAAAKAYLAHYPDKRFLGQIKAVPLARFQEVISDRQLRGKKVAEVLDVFLGILKEGSVFRAAGRFLTQSPGRTALVGAGAGGAVGAAAQGPDASIGERVMGGLQGSVMGAAVGGAGGAVGRTVRDARLRKPGMTAAQTAGAVGSDLGNRVKNFGRRQLHGMFGAYKGREGQIGLASSQASTQRAGLLKLRQADEVTGLEGARRSKIESKYREELNALRDRGIMGDKAIQAGITNIPGVAKSLVTNPKGTAKALWSHATNGGGRAGVALSVGAPLALAVPDLARGDESAAGGRSLGEKVVGAGTGLATGMLTAPLPGFSSFITQEAMMQAADRGSKRVFRGKPKE